VIPFKQPVLFDGKFIVESFQALLIFAQQLVDLEGVDFFFAEGHCTINVGILWKDIFLEILVQGLIDSKRLPAVIVWSSIFDGNVNVLALGYFAQNLKEFKSVEHAVFFLLDLTVEISSLAKNSVNGDWIETTLLKHFGLVAEIDEPIVAEIRDFIRVENQMVVQVLNLSEVSHESVPEQSHH